MPRRVSRHHAFWVIVSAVRSGRMAYDGRSASGSAIGNPVSIKRGGGPLHWLMVPGPLGQLRGW